MAGARFSLTSAQHAPAADTKGSLVLLDFGDANDKQIRDATIARFNKRYPNVKVTDQCTPISSWSDYLDKLIAQVASGKTPDLIHIATEGAQLAIRKNLVISLDEFTKSDASAKDLLSDIDPVLLNGFTVEGRLYLVPEEWNNMMIYYNTKVFKEAGIPRPSDDWTWTTFFQSPNA
jgi:multiple sugar transport system substrate-binding protein